MTYPEIVYQHLQNIIQREIDYTTRDKMVKSPQRKRIVTLQDVANALLYFEGGSLSKELKRAGLDYDSLRLYSTPPPAQFWSLSRRFSRFRCTGYGL